MNGKYRAGKRHCKLLDQIEFFSFSVISVIANKEKERNSLP